MVKTAIIHIGLHKTGSTAIQNWCYSHQKLLIQQGIFYPNGASQFQGGHHPVAWGLTPVENKNRKIFSAQRLVIHPDCHTILLSSEEFEFSREPSIQRLKSELGAKKCTIIVYVRNNLEFLLAEYQQHVKMAEIQFSNSVENFFIRHNMYSRLNYTALAKKWAEVFGNAALQIVLYDDVRSKLISDFSARLGIKIPNVKTAPIVNKSLNAVSTEILCRYNQIKGTKAKRNSFLANLTKLESPEDDKYCLLDPELATQILLNLRGSLINLKKQFGTDIEGLSTNLLIGKKIIPEHYIQERQRQLLQLL